MRGNGLPDFTRGLFPKYVEIFGEGKTVSEYQLRHGTDASGYCVVEVEGAGDGGSAGAGEGWGIGMISAETTLLILGAGASMQYGLPLGRGLRDIITNLNGEKAQKLFLGFNIFPKQLEEFRVQFLQSEQYSIDRFLLLRQEFAVVGKLAIAYALINKEDNDALLRGTQTDAHWYGYLWNKLCEAGDALAQNRLRIVTFNYDRSLEHYLAGAYSATFKTPYKTALEKIAASMPIRHVYGDLGRLGDNVNVEQGVRPYDRKIDFDTLKIASTSIRTIHERDQDKTCFDAIKQDLEWANKVCFLGFGFDSINLQRLGFHAGGSAQKTIRQSARAYGTSKGLEAEEMSMVRSVVRDGGEPVNVFLDDCDCETLLRRYYGVLR